MHKFKVGTVLLLLTNVVFAQMVERLNEALLGTFGLLRLPVYFTFFFVAFAGLAYLKFKKMRTALVLLVFACISVLAMFILIWGSQIYSTTAFPNCGSLDCSKVCNDPEVQTANNTISLTAVSFVLMLVGTAIFAFAKNKEKKPLNRDVLLATVIIGLGLVLLLLVLSSFGANFTVMARAELDSANCCKCGWA